jgi:hypothetical protein
MALHLVKLPARTASHLFKVVVLQRTLLKALAAPHLRADAVDAAWVQNVWRRLDAGWVRKFCLGGQEGRIQAIAAASPLARHALYEEFCRQNKVQRMLQGGGDFRDLAALPDFNPALAEQVKNFFMDCYDVLGQSSRSRGHALPGGGVITKRTYNDSFRESYPTKTVCPYCDGEIGTPDLDHYYSKSLFPLLACAPWNLVPICKSCNDVATAKGNRPALELGPPCSAENWLHPFFRAASSHVAIGLRGTPRDSIPKLYSPDAAEQARLDNHTDLIRTLSSRWTNIAAMYFDSLVHQTNRRVTATNSAEDFIKLRLDDHCYDRGKAPSSMVHSAVCRAVLDRRPEYLEEFAAPNAPRLA